MGSVSRLLDSMSQLTVVTMMTMSMILMVGIVAVMGKDTRDDGLCGSGNPAPSGKPAKCEHIPPFPTCCQKNGHCGWDCDDVHIAPDPVPTAPSRPLFCRQTMSGLRWPCPAPVDSETTEDAAPSFRSTTGLRRVVIQTLNTSAVPPSVTRTATSSAA